jgi:putative flippase GtrA
MLNISLFKKRDVFQFLRFVAVGFLNTAIDFGILNFLRWVFAATSGWPILVFNGISVSAAMGNSYFLNKYWAFKKKETENRLMETILFVFFTALGMGINTLIVYYFSTNLSPVFGINEVLWLNIGKVFATGVSLLWNFFWYKFVVFRARSI